MLQTALTRMLDLKLPIVGAPMAGVSGGRLAAAVSGAGGLGMIGIGSAATEQFVSEHCGIAREQGGPFGVGLIVWSLPKKPGFAEAVAAQQPALVGLSFGDAAPYAGIFRDAGAKVAAQVNTVEDARKAQDAGVELLVAQGTEAGGHTGLLSTLPLLQAVLEIADVPVLAAGGIVTGAGLAAVLAAGAAGAWIGTALLACPEAENSQTARERIVAAHAEDTVRTHVFDAGQGIPWPDRWAGRALRNSYTDRWHGHEQEMTGEARAKLAAARERRDYDIAQLYAGEAVGLVGQERSAAEVVTTIAADAEVCLQRASALTAPDSDSAPARR